MAGNPTYASVSVSNYNASAPADDGSQVASNLIKWAHVKEKIGDPIKTALESINTNIDAAIDAVKMLYAVRTTKSADYTTVVGDDGTVFSVSGTTTITLLAAATATAGYRIGIYKSDAAGTNVTIDGNASETINGLTTLTLTSQYEFVTLVCDGTNWVATFGTFLDGTVSLPGIRFQSDSDTGFYRPAANQVGVVLAGTETALFSGNSLHLKQGANDDAIQTWQSSDVTHGVTDIAVTNAYGYVKKNDAGAGVLEIGGLAESGNGASLMLAGYANSSSTSASTGARSVVETASFSFSGASIANLAANAMSFGVRVQTGGAQATKFIVDVEGDTFQDGTAGTAYDDYDDADLNADFNNWLGTNRNAPDFPRMERLAKLKVIGRVTREEWNRGIRPLWSPGKMVQIHTGALVQAANRESILWETLERFLPGSMAYAASLSQGRNVGRLPTRMEA